MLVFLSYLLVSAAFAADADFLIEKTYPRDNTFCTVQNKRLEVQLRGSSRYTESRDKGYAEYAFYRLDQELLPLPLNKDRMDSFELFDGKGSVCSKSYGYNLSDGMLAILFLKENNPFSGKLTIQLFDTKLGRPAEVIETDYATHTTEIFKDGFAFPALIERTEVENGKVTIENILYHYQNLSLTPWLSYTRAGFEIRPALTYTHSEWKEFFADEKEFLETFEWNSVEKKFNKSVIYKAYNHKEKKTCILPVSERQQLTGLEKWRCR